MTYDAVSWRILFSADCSSEVLGRELGYLARKSSLCTRWILVLLLTGSSSKRVLSVTSPDWKWHNFNLNICGYFTLKTTQQTKAVDKYDIIYIITSHKNVCMYVAVVNSMRVIKSRLDFRNYVLSKGNFLTWEPVSSPQQLEQLPILTLRWQLLWKS